MYHQQPGARGGGGGPPSQAPGIETGASGGGATGLPPGFEDRLRNMILHGNGASESHFNPGTAPTHAPNTSNGGPPPASPGKAHLGAAPQAGNLSESAHAGRRRPNQAQRRQMSAQFSIPIDPRSTQPTPTGNHNAGLPAFGMQQSFRPSYPHHPNFHQQTQQRPQTATGRPAHYGHGPGQPTGLGGGPPYPSQPRHHQSLSYQGPTAYNDSYNWQARPAPPQAPVPVPFDAMAPRGGRHHAPAQRGRIYVANQDEIQTQATFLEGLCERIVSHAEIEPDEIQEKELFRARIERLCQEALAKYEFEVNGRSDFPPASVRLRCFGSLASGFATKASDMDLGIISPASIPQPDAPKSPIPRLLEKALLDANLGARLISRTRVPIIKLCEKPPKQLLLDLLEERAKWERGLLPEHDGPDGEEYAADDQDAAIVPTTFEGNGEGGNKPEHNRSESVLDSDQLDGDKYIQTLAQLKQPANQSIWTYYGAAKRTLRKLACRDITHATVREATDRDLKTLTDVCRAFVEGLNDSELKSRLLATRSLVHSDKPSPQTYRSLYGVLMQVEGERLALLWEKRKAVQGDARQEADAAMRMQAWRNLQNKPGFVSDPLGYNKELQLAVDGLKKIVWIQVATLEQGPFESPTQYYERTAKLLRLSSGRDRIPGGSIIGAGGEMLSLVVQQYVAGIFNRDLRSQVESFAQTLDQPCLRAVAQRHKSLHLALEFERALAKDCYEGAVTDDVQAYIDVLRMPLQVVRVPPEGRMDYILPVTVETAGVIARARQLDYPSSLPPNQPRDPYRDRLEMPKTGTGVQCDINFAAHLGLQNTLLLRCYSHTDARVRPLVLFVKHWAKMRDINTPYRGTLGSYGYVLMLLHYLVNVAQPFVCPNLQQLARPVPKGLSPAEYEETVSCRGRDVRFWRDEEEIQQLASKGMLTQNTDSIGHLLRGFFEYYAQSNFMSTVGCRGFDWGRDVLSLRTAGGLRSKQSKGWTGARTVLEVQNQAMTPPATVVAAAPAASTTTTTTTTTTPTTAAAAAPAPEMKEVKHRFLFAIEDPFELDHNVARTVTHSGIVAIRDEFRRAWRIIKNTGRVADEALLADATDHADKERKMYAELLAELHGPV